MTGRSAAPADGLAVVISADDEVGSACAAEVATVTGLAVTTVGGGSHLTARDGAASVGAPAMAADAVGSEVAELAAGRRGPVLVLVTVGPLPLVGVDPDPDGGAHLLMVQAALREVVPGQIDVGYGRVVLIVGPTGISGTPWSDGQGITSGGLIGLVRTAGRDLARHGITVNAVRSGPLDSARQRAAGEADPAAASAAGALARSAPLRRLASVDDVAAAVGYFVDPSSSYVTGSVLPVDAGLTMGLGAI